MQLCLGSSLVERSPEERSVESSILSLGTIFGPIAQWESEELITLRSGVQFTLGLPSLGSAIRLGGPSGRL